VEINNGQFFTSLATNMKNRMMTTRSSGRTCAQDIVQYEKVYLDLLNGINFINPDTWPEDIETNVLYGETEVSFLCRRFTLPTRQTIQEFREFKDNGGKYVSNSLFPLKKAVSTLVVSTAECERGFSQMNVIMSPIRTSLAISRLFKLLFIKCAGLPLNRFSPLPQVKTWLTKGHCSSDDTKARSCTVDTSDFQKDYCLGGHVECLMEL